MNSIQTNNISDNSKYSIYGLLAQLYEYPKDESYKKNIISIYETLRKEIPEAAESMEFFIDFINEASISEIQELYLRSFDVQAITTLDIGFVLFGEDYKRGQLLVNLNREHRDASNECNTELADSLPNVLNLLSKMTNFEMREEIASKLVIPAIVKMSSEFSTEKIEKKDVIYKKHLKTLIDFSQKYRIVYQTILNATLVVLKRDFKYDINILNYFKDEKCHDEAQSCSCSTEEKAEPISFTNNNYFKDFSEQIEIEMIIEK
ncbi:MAG: hypothetical protein IT243_10270 [Bacteroidia bacterium]|nr:hypothetical protein [Bacteroidia bacterium]